MNQLNLFDVLRRPPVTVAIDRNGPVIKGDVDETLTLPHPRMAWDYAEIELHRHTDGLWMWSVSWNADMGGGGYRVGAKWGKFAETRDDALYYACCELETRVRGDGKEAALIMKWVAGLKATVG